MIIIIYIPTKLKYTWTYFKNNKIKLFLFFLFLFPKTINKKKVCIITFGNWNWLFYLTFQYDILRFISRTKNILCSFMRINMYLWIAYPFQKSMAEAIEKEDIENGERILIHLTDLSKGFHRWMLFRKN